MEPPQFRIQRENFFFLVSIVIVGREMMNA